MRYSDFVKADNIHKLINRLMENDKPYLLESDEKKMIIDLLPILTNSEQNPERSVARDDDSSTDDGEQKNSQRTVEGL
jgi:hypothetical protein